MKEVIQISKETMDGIRYRARRKAMEEHREKSKIRISPRLKKQLSRISKKCGHC